MLFHRKSIRDGAWVPGTLAIASHRNHSSYPIGRGAFKCDYSLIRFNPVGDPPAVPVPEFCGGQCDESSGIKLTVSINCALDPITVNIPYPDAGEDLGAHLLCHLKEESRLVALGYFGWDADNNTLNFRGAMPGLKVDFSVSVDPSIYDVCVESAAVDPYSGRYDDVTAGSPVVLAPDRQMDSEAAAFVPSQDVNADGATEVWLGIAICTGNAGEKAPIINPVYPDFAGCDENCAPRPTCVSVVEDDDPVILRLEKPWVSGSKLYYRFAPDEANGFIESAFSGQPGDGLAEVPRDAIVLDSREGGSLIKVKLR